MVIATRTPQPIEHLETDGARVPIFDAEETSVTEPQNIAELAIEALDVYRIEESPIGCGMMATQDRDSVLIGLDYHDAMAGHPEVGYLGADRGYFSIPSHGLEVRFSVELIRVIPAFERAIYRVRFELVADADSATEVRHE